MKLSKRLLESAISYDNIPEKGKAESSDKYVEKLLEDAKKEV